MAHIILQGELNRIKLVMRPSHAPYLAFFCVRVSHATHPKIVPGTSRAGPTLDKGPKSLRRHPLDTDLVERVDGASRDTATPDHSYYDRSELCAGAFELNALAEGGKRVVEVFECWMHVWAGQVEQGSGGSNGERFDSKLRETFAETCVACKVAKGSGAVAFCVDQQLFQSSQLRVVACNVHKWKQALTSQSR